MMCKNLPAHQGSFLSSCQMEKRKETKSLKYQATLKVHRAITLQGGSGGGGHPTTPRRELPTPASISWEELLLHSHPDTPHS